MTRWAGVGGAGSAGLSAAVLRASTSVAAGPTSSPGGVG
jgi:hypothetical protein